VESPVLQLLGKKVKLKKGGKEMAEKKQTKEKQRTRVIRPKNTLIVAESGIKRKEQDLCFDLKTYINNG
jgi:hypothetical protein